MSTALVTGASGGIGYELAKLLARHQHNLIMVARNSEKLSRAADEFARQFQISARPIALDLSSPPAPQFLFDQLQREGIAVDILVNNAGYGVLGEFAGVSLEENLAQIQLNITALTALTRLFVGPMITRGSGRILNIASTAGFQAGPRMAVYYASKAYVISFSEALANELRSSGVTVTCLCPGATDTEFQVRAGTDATILFKSRHMSASAVARDGYRAMMAGKTLAISGFVNWAVAQSTRFAPRKLVTAISRKLLDKA